MPICRYFISGKCVYGTKCFNDHLNIGPVVQTLVKQRNQMWPLSSFGPIDGDRSLPNFVEDQSYEEVRYNYSLAKQMNSLPQYNQKLKNDMMKAQQAYARLAAGTPDVQAYLVDTYGVNNNAKDQQQQHPQQQQQQQPNPFGSPTAMGGNSGGSIFSRIGQTQPVQQQTNIFGQVPAGTQQQISGSFFGGSNQSVFGQQQAQPVPPQMGGNIFGGQQQQLQQPTTMANQQQGQGGFFKIPQLGQQPTQQLGQGNSIFGGQQQQQQQQQPAGNIFGGGQANAGIFGGGQVHQQQPQANPFASQQQQQPPAFGQPEPPPAFPQNAFGAVNQAPNVFQTTQQAVQQQQSSPFGQQQPPNMQNAGNIFGQMQQNQTQPTMFGQEQQQQQQQPPAGDNIFGNVAQNAMQAAQQVAFGMTESQGIKQPTGSVFGQPQPPLDNNSSIYSKLENLNPEDLAKFQAAEFTFKDIPTTPPPYELCI